MPDLGESATFELSPFCCACWRSCGRVESARGVFPSDAAAGHGKSPPKRPSFACSTSLGHTGGQRRFFAAARSLGPPDPPRALGRDTNLCRPLPTFTSPQGLGWVMNMPDLGESATFELSPFCCTCWRSCGRVESARGVWGAERCGSWSRQIAPQKTFVRAFNFARSHWGAATFLPRLDLSAPQTPRALLGVILISVGPCRHFISPAHCCLKRPLGHNRSQVSGVIRLNLARLKTLGTCNDLANGIGNHGANFHD